MNLKPITPILSVSEQIQPQEVAALAAAVRATGMQAAYLPVVSGNIDDADVQAFGLLMERLPSAILAYCRTGTRSATLWSLSEASRGRPFEEIVSATKVAGYDMAGVMRALPMARKKTKVHAIEITEVVPAHS